MATAILFYCFKFKFKTQELSGVRLWIRNFFLVTLWRIARATKHRLRFQEIKIKQHKER
jgi:hypothetical protein